MTSIAASAVRTDDGVAIQVRVRRAPILDEEMRRVQPIDAHVIEE